VTPGPAGDRSTDGSADGAGRHLVVVGGGVTGLAAAWEASARADVTVTVLEASDRLGGKVRTSAIDLPGGPRTVDEGADNFLARVPDAVELCVELGLEDQLIEPAIGRAAVWARGAVRPYPTRHVLGVPLDADELARTGIVSDDAVRAVAGEVDSTDPAPPDDVAIGAFIGGRFGREVVEHLVGPLVGGINAGDVDELSLRAVTPQLAAAAADGASLTLALRHRLAAAPPSGPVFRALAGGTATLVDTLADRLRERGAGIHTSTAVTGLGATTDGRIAVTVADRPALVADSVVVAAPAPTAAELVGDLSPAAAAHLRRIVHVPVAFVTVALDASRVTVPEGLSGVLVPRDAGLLATAVSFGSRKWPHWSDGAHTVLRVAVGHRHDDRPADLDDDELVAAVRADLSTVLGVGVAPVAARVSRWSPGFAQYQVGHLELVGRIRSALGADAPAVRVVGADLGGLGLPACIAQGRGASRELLF